MATTIRLDLENLSCAGCARRADGALAAVAGVTSATTNFATRSAEVTGTATTADLTAALRTAGYPARMARTDLTVAGMSCASCTSKVERALMALPGVTAARANLATGTVMVDHLAGQSADALRDAVGQAGYTATLRDADAPTDPAASETTRTARRAALAAALTLPVFVLEMGGHLIPAFHHWVHTTIGHPQAWWLQFVLTTLVLAGPGRGFFAQGIPRLLRGGPDMNSLVALGTGAAWAYSTLVLVAPALIPEAARAVYFEAAAVIVTLVLLGRWMEARARGRTGAAIRALAGLQPRTARVERDGTATEVPLEQIRPGDILHLRPGERVAVDGEVTSGTSHIDESMISGEPMPVEKTEGAEVIGGTVNTTGALRFRATRVGGDTMLASIIRTMEAAQAGRLPIEALVDRVVAVFVPVVMAVAALTVAVWLALGPDPALTFALVAGVSVLIIACPCAMGLATPTSILVGTGRAAEMGVLFRRGEALQALAEVDLVAFDKTGTLTEGRPELASLHPAEGFEEAEVLRLAAAAEGGSEHPIARAVLRAAEARDLPVPQADAFEARPGFGLSATVDGRHVLIGAARLMTAEGIDTSPLSATADTAAGRGETPLFVAIDGRLAALLTVADPIKPSARETIARLHAMGVRTALITGDATATARSVAAELGIEEVLAEVLPTAKAEAVTRLRGTGGGRIAFVGDGINDAPALAEADVGIAIGTGTDVAIEAADVVLVSGDPAGVVNALHAGRATLRNIRQNLAWAFGYNTLLIPVAAGALWPVAGVMLSPMLAAGAMSLSSVSVLANALRLRGLKPVLTPRGATRPAPTPRRAAA
nr:heavy metal translocating P-type ATPase [Rhodobaculum claviforme]